MLPMEDGLTFRILTQHLVSILDSLEIRSLPMSISEKRTCARKLFEKGGRRLPKETSLPI